MRISQKKWILFLLAIFFLINNRSYAQLLASPALQSPPNGAVNQPTALTLDWDGVTGATTYQVQVATDDNFTNLVVNQNELLNTSRDVSGLNSGTTYYWRVRASNGVTTSDWSGVWSFTTESPSNPPEAPQLVSPSNGAGGVSTGPTLDWNSAQGADSYRLQVATDASFSSPVVNESGLSSTSYQASGLNNATTYYWRVRATNEDGNSSWSAEWSFTTEQSAPQPPPAPALVAPSNGANGISTDPTLEWNSANGADSYHLQVATDNSFSNPAVNESGLTGTSRQVSNLDNSTTYYWRVRAANEDGTGDWSSSWSFTTDQPAPQPPAAPVLASPSNGAGGVTTSPELQWNSVQNADSYRVQVATDDSFGSSLIDRSGITATSYQAPDLDPNTTYYWRVQAANEDGAGDWSDSWSFTTEQSSQPLTAPALASPSNGAVNQPTALTLNWDDVTGATSYQVQVSTAQDFSNLVVDQSGITNTSYELSGLDYETTYYWRVRATNGITTSDWSDVWNFTTVPAPPPAPSLNAPADGASGVPTDPAFSWDPVQSADTYQVQVATDAGFSSLAVNESGLTSASYQAVGLSNSTEYYWRVRASNEGGNGNWSAVRNFTTASPGGSQPPVHPTLVSPSNGADGISTSPTLQWNSVQNADSYRLQVAQSSGFSSPVVDQEGISSTSLQVNELSNATTYYWRVLATNENGSSDWSSSWSFTTEQSAPQPPPAPALVAPSNGANGISTDPTLEWNSANGADSYHLQVATDNSFSNPAVNESGLTGTSRQVSNLDNSTTYYWRVRAANEGGTGSWSEVWSFTTEDAPSNPPETPTLVSPSDGASGVSTGPTLDWNSAQGADSYRLQVATDASFSSPVVNESGLSSTSYQASGLNNATTYYWRVRATNEDGNSSWSAEWSFTTEQSAPQPPPAPALVAPSNGANGISTDPTLEWNSANGADSYHLQVATDNSFSNPAVNSSGLTGTSRQVSNLDNSTTYYWRVRASNDGGTGNWSEVWSFTTEDAPSNPPETPTLVSPSDGASGVSTGPTLDWNSAQGADSYRLQVATDASFSSPVVNESGLSSTSYQASGLNNATTYYWRVRATNEDGNSSWSAEWSFTTEQSAPQPPPAPALVAPSNGASGISTDPTLEWNSANGADSYHLQVATDNSFSNPAVNSSGLTGTSRQVSNLDNSTTYYWRVRASNEGGTGDWSEVWSFTTEDAPSNPPETPTLVSPSDGASGVSTGPTLDWNSAQGADSYRLQVATDASFGSPVVNESGLSSTSYQASGLNNATTYYWRVRATNEDGNSSWSAEWSFTTEQSAPQPPDSPDLVSPDDGAVSISVRPTLDWNAADRANSYELQIATDNNFNAIVANKDGLTATDYQTDSLDYATTYYWRVRARNSSGNSGWSSTWDFTTEDQPQSPPAAPELTSPSDGSSGVSTSPTLDWITSDRAESYRLQLAEDSGFSSIVTDSSQITSTELQAQSLNNSTTYYWRVQASNSAGNSSWSNTWSFTTISTGSGQAPPPPQLVSPEDGTGDISTTPLLDWKSAEGAETYDFQIATDQNFQAIVVSLKNVTSTQYEADLEGNTTYYWRVKSKNSNGESQWTNPWSFSTKSTGNAITIVDPDTKALWKARNTHTIRWEATNQVSSVRLEYSTDDGKSWNLIAEEINAGDTVYGWDVPNQSSDLTRVKITDEDNAANSATSPPFVIYPRSVQLNKEFVFPSSPSQSDYKLIGIPGKSDIPIGQIISGTYGDDWQAFYDNGNSENYLEEYDQSSKFTFKPGLGFWVVHRGNIQVNQNTPTVSLDTDTTYTISLHKGWNIISNPFHSPVNWEAVKTANNLGDPVWGFDGQFTQKAVINPYKGYYFFNRDGRSELKIPYKPEISTKSGKTKSPSSATGDQMIVSLSVYQGDRKMSTVRFGVDPAAARVPSKRFQPAPPGNFQHYKLTIKPTPKENTEFDLAEIRRTSIDELSGLNLKLKSVAGQPVTLKTEGIDKLLPYQVALIHHKTGKVFQLDDNNPVRTQFDEPTGSFKLVVGTSEEIEQQKQQAKPKQLTLSQNYPNPFNGQTVIEYSIPEQMGQTDVSLEIFDILGRRVYTLVDARRQPGLYQVRWNGKTEMGQNLATGVYYYRLIIGKSVITKKLTLIK